VPVACPASSLIAPLRSATIDCVTSPRYDDQPEEFARLTLLDEIGPLGDCLADFEGQHINVFGGIPGEEVVAQIVRYRRRRKLMISGLVTEVVTASPYRVEAPCQYFGACTGCQWQHILYSHQLVLKRGYVERELAEYPSLTGVEIEPTIPAPKLYGYRNHARFTIKREGSPGFVNRITRRFVQTDECMIMTAGINRLSEELRGKSAETTQLAIRYGVNTDDWLIQPTLKNEEISLTTGQTHYTERMLDKNFRVGSPSFFQVNTEQAERLATLVGELLDLSGTETVVDAYAGVGTFAILLAESAKKIIAIEESAAAIKDASFNAEGIDNVEFREGKTEDVLNTLEIRPDAVILDPSRSGCHPTALAEVIRWAPERTAYVSCDPEALGRDLDILVRGGLRVESVQPIDMFPQTHHIETVALLTPGV
jgi:23S rRNA (uracil1939-C5)-methyltransferase